MNIWILTIGSSDVQLDSNSVSEQKGRTPEKYSDKVWKYWYDDDLQFEHKLPSSEAPTRSGKDKRDTYRILPRVLGIVYKFHPENIQQEILSYLTFPLLDSFTQALKDYPDLQTIVILLTDQSMIRSKDNDIAYWKDTCELEPILCHYFQQKFPSSHVEIVMLSPIEPQKGLDNWDAVFGLVDQKFKTLSIDKQEQSGTIFVSHQAGTPALSSAVQFCSLAKFTDRVRFLVSNEYNPELTGFVASSSYLRGIKQEQAKKLLENYDYAGVEQLVGKDLIENDRVLMDAALEWNVAQFKSFVNLLKKHPSFLEEEQRKARTKQENWWWIAYEEVFLSLVRHRQGNVVEAFFHSFRAFEYIFAAWGEQRLGKHIEFIKNIPYLNPSVLDDPADYFSDKRCKDVSNFKDLKSQLEKLRVKQPEEIKRHDRLELNMANLCKIFRAFRYKEYKRDCEELKTFWDNDTDKNISDKRNFIFHQVQGMTEADLWKFWGVSSLKEWEEKLLKFLNFIVREDFPQGFGTLQEASLLPKVHEELKKAIGSM